MNPIVIKKNAVFLANQLCYIFNLSFEKGLYPSRLKNSIVAPIFKYGSRNDPENYRPISILSIFAKLFEKLFLNVYHPLLKKIIYYAPISSAFDPTNLPI